MNTPNRTTCWILLGLLAAMLLMPTAAWAQPGEDGARSPIQGDRWYNALWALGLFAVLMAVLGRFAWKPVMKTLKDRERFVADQLADVRRRQVEAEEQLAEYHERLRHTEEQAKQIIERARREAQTLHEKTLREAQQSATEMVEQAHREIEQARLDALEELYQRSAELATQMAGQIVQRQFKAEDHLDLIESHLDRLRKAGQDPNRS